MRSFPFAIITTIAVGCAWLPASLAAAPSVDSVPAYVAAPDRPALVRVLFLGDSISLGYMPGVRARLEGRANVHQAGEDCRGTTLGLQRLDAWLGSGRWDLIHFNFGLHDVLRSPDGMQTSLTRYENNLREIVRRLKLTGAKLIFATTTPIPEGIVEGGSGDEVSYNEVARRVMKENGIPLDDLWEYIKPRQTRIQLRHDVHFEPYGYELLADMVAGSIYPFLPPPPGNQWDPSWAEVPDVPRFPRVLLIGDSISEGYTLLVRARLKGRANVHRPPQNCGSTLRGLERLDAWLGTGHWDVIHFNFGLHDMKYTNEGGYRVTLENGKQVSTLPQYEKNLREIVRRLQGTGAKLIFATTTPVPAGCFGFTENDEVRYNEVAARVMKENAIAVDDLWSFVKPRQASIQNLRDVHYSESGYEQIADIVATSIADNLR
ncbi:MAG: SGNH/GDSL hydrolase family protein [Opitutaceae bacterium]|nr:SGNH/GDSL hydrolase family protein [Opitutaceae bacterium]